MRGRNEKSDETDFFGCGSTRICRFDICTSTDKGRDETTRCLFQRLREDPNAFSFGHSFLALVQKIQANRARAPLESDFDFSSRESSLN